MAILYIANTTKQHHDFLYRVAEENGRTRIQKIMSGEQIRVHKEETKDVLMNIVDQHVTYGLVEAAKIDQTKPFIGLCYAFDKPIAVEKFMYADEHNMSVLEEQGREIRRTQAAALHGQIEQAGDSQLQSLQTEVVEQTRETDVGLNEIIEVSKDQDATTRRGKKQRR